MNVLCRSRKKCNEGIHGTYTHGPIDGPRNAPATGDEQAKSLNNFVLCRDAYAVLDERGGSG